MGRAIYSSPGTSSSVTHEWNSVFTMTLPRDTKFHVFYIKFDDESDRLFSL